MPRIFINYRRDDSAGYAGRIHDTLASAFGTDSVFIDIDDIKPGVDYVSTIEERIAGCDVMLTLIGHRWLDSQDASGSRRLDDPADFVRVEIERALARHIRVIPVLIGTASMPGQSDLPPDISQLATLEATALSDSRWQYDMAQLVNAIGESVPRQRGSALVGSGWRLQQLRSPARCSGWRPGSRSRRTMYRAVGWPTCGTISAEAIPKRSSSGSPAALSRARPHFSGSPVESSTAPSKGPRSPSRRVLMKAPAVRPAKRNTNMPEP